MKRTQNKKSRPQNRRRMYPGDFRVDKLLKMARKIWGNDRLDLQRILIRLGKGYGDLCLIARERPHITAFGGFPQSDREKAIRELQKELGNIIFSTIRWCDDLGFNPEECILAGIESQRRYAADRTKLR